MAFEISTGKKQNSQGRVAVSLRFRMGWKRRVRLPPSGTRDCPLWAK